MSEQLLENFYRAKNSFYQELIENYFFDKGKFNDLETAVFELHQSGLLNEQRLPLAIELWEFSYLISRALSWHHDVRDTYKIKNLASDDDRQIDAILYYLCNWFSYNKPMQKESLEFGVW